MKYVWRAAALLLVLTGSIALAATMEPDLANRLGAADANQKFAVDFFMKAQANALSLDQSIENLPKPQRRARVASVLQEYSAATQRDLLDYLKSQETAGKVDDIRSLWLCNLVGCWATKDVIYAVAARNDVDLVVYGKVPVEVGKIDLSAPVPPIDGIEPNMVTTNVRGAWKQGYHGEGIVLGVVDTGVWYTHDDLTNHLWESTIYPNHGFNYASSQFSSGHPGPSSYDTLTPLDYYGHGTHCAGIATADGAYGNGTSDTMGIAPATRLMCLPVDVYLHSPYPDTSMENNTMLGYQFCVSPPRDPTNGADAITTSLGLIASWLPRRAIFRACEENINAAGIPHMIAAGNEGPTARSIRTSGDCPPPWPNPVNNPTDHAVSAVITIGATDNSDAAASFTSIGPSDWGSISPYNDYAYPPGLLDPDVMMPGVNILSTYYNGNRAYTTMSGTSMATPGAAGVVCLMLSKNPRLTPRQIDSILEMHSVRDLGPSGKDNTYGAGRINCSLAVAFTPLPSGLRLHRRIVDDASPGGNGDGIVNPGETVNFPTWILNLDASVRNGVVGKITKRNPGDPLFSITDSMKTFGDIPPNDSAYTGSSGYKIAVSGSAVNGSVLGIDLTLKDASDSVWLNGYDVAVGAPVLTAAGVVIRDSVGGNGNGRLDPGEQADVIVLLHNGGLGNAYAVSGVLSSSNPSWLAVNDPNGVYGDIPFDATVGNFGDRYVVTASAGAPPGTAIPCTLHVSGTGYATLLVFSITVGIPPQPPGTIIWGPKTAPGVPSSYGLYGMGYDYVNDVLYGSYHYNGLIYKFASDSNLTALGTIPAPNNDTGVHDIKYCAYDNTLWIHDYTRDAVYKTDLSGTILRSFPSPANDYGTGLAWDEVARVFYLFDRRTQGVQPEYMYVCDTLGNVIAQLTHPLNADIGARGAALDITNSNPNRPTVINLYSWFSPGTILDSCGVLEMDRTDASIIQWFRMPDVGWNCRGVEYDPRDGSFWVSIMQNLNPPPDNNSIVKMYGFHIPTAVGDFERSRLQGDRLWIRAAPNPFRTGTLVRFNLPAMQPVRVRVYDASGRVVRTLVDGTQGLGEHTVLWDGMTGNARRATPGIYFVRCQTANSVVNSKLVFLK